MPSKQKRPKPAGSFDCKPPLKKIKGHATCKTSQSKVKPLPEKNPKWTASEFANIKTVGDFLKVTNKPKFQKIIANEVSQEAERAINKDNVWNNQKSYVGVYSWSLLWQIETTFPDMTSGCTGSKKCLLSLFKSELENINVTITYVQMVVKQMYDLRLHLHPKIIQGTVSTAGALMNTHTELFKIISQSKWLKRKFKTKDTQSTFIANIKLKVKPWDTELSRQTGGTAAQNRSLNRQRHPIIVPEETILKLRDFLREKAFNEEELVVYKNNKWELTDTCRYCCLLLQASIGSRYRGILLHNNFQKFKPQLSAVRNTNTKDSWDGQYVMDDVDENDLHMFVKSQNDLLTVSRLSKEGSELSKKVKKKSKTRKMLMEKMLKL